MSQKIRINIYLDESLGEAFKRYCKSKKLSYSQVAESLFYRLLIKPSNSKSSVLAKQQEDVNREASKAYRDVHDSNRKATIQNAITESESVQPQDVSPKMPIPPMPIPMPQGGDKHEIRTNHLSKRKRG